MTIFDKARTPGGRASSRLSRKDASWSFDHGAPYFESSDLRVQRWFQNWEEVGVLRRWESGDQHKEECLESAAKYVGVPTNQALPRHLATDLNIVTSTRIEGITPIEEGSKQAWLLKTDTETHGPFDVLVMNLPAPQLLALLPEVEQATAFPEFEPCHALLLRFEGPLSVDWSTARPDGHPMLKWICRESSKPGRPNAEQWLVQSQGDWSKEHLETDLSEVERLLTEAFLELRTPNRRPGPDSPMALCEAISPSAGGCTGTLETNRSLR